MRWIKKILFLLLAQNLWLSFAVSQENATAEEAKAMVLRGLSHIEAVGLQKAMEDFSSKDGKWVDRDLYIFVMNYDGVFLAHGSNRGFVGKNMLQLNDANGKFFVKEFVAVAKSGRNAWVDYLWTNPTTRKIEEKSSYVVAIPGHDCFLSVGYYHKK